MRGEGSVAEWSIAPVLKTGGPKGSVSSNLTASASYPPKLFRQLGRFLLGFEKWALAGKGRLEPSPPHPRPDPQAKPYPACENGVWRRRSPVALAMALATAAVMGA